MRGFTMILVVAYHVSMMGYGENPKDSSYLSLCVLFRMPLFFFISGFFAYSSRTQWSLPVLVRSLWKKFRIQVIPTVVFFALFIIMLHRGSWDKAVSLLQHDTKGGYWFTIVLLQMFVIYYLFAYVEHFFAPRLERLRLRWLPITLLWLCALCVYATWYMPSWFHYQKQDWLQWSSFSQTIIFSHFFLAGNIVHRYWDRFQRLFDARWFAPLITNSIPRAMARARSSCLSLSIRASLSLSRNAISTSTEGMSVRRSTQRPGRSLRPRFFVPTAFMIWCRMQPASFSASPPMRYTQISVPRAIAFAALQCRLTKISAGQSLAAPQTVASWRSA